VRFEAAPLKVGGYLLYDDAFREVAGLVDVFGRGGRRCGKRGVGGGRLCGWGGVSLGALNGTDARTEYVPTVL
jgi:hypothetical protein